MQKLSTLVWLDSNVRTFSDYTPRFISQHNTQLISYNPVIFGRKLN